MRKTKEVTITENNRDEGKTFLLTEMPAAKSDRWATRALMALAKSGVDVPEDIEGLGLAGVAAMGIRALMGARFDEFEPLLDEMISCIQVMPDASNKLLLRRLNVNDDIEEISTLWLLRSEAIELHVNFSIREALSRFRTSTTAPALA